MSAIENLWDEQLLWAKARQYIDIAYDQDREEWLFAFWATLSLELLARAALSHIHPALLANTSERDGRHLIYSLGLLPSTKNYMPKSIEVSDVFDRCEALIPDFTKDHAIFCKGLMGRRNEELHSGGAPFADISLEAWLHRYYDSCSILVSFLGRTLADYVGDAEAKAAATMIESLKDDAAKAVLGEIAAYKTVWQAKDEKDRIAAAELASVEARRDMGHIVTCPACGSKAVLLGEEMAALPSALGGDKIITKSVMLPISFACKACGIQIKGHNKLLAAGLGSQFTRTELFDPIECEFR
jgi:hypothetical protein